MAHSLESRPPLLDHRLVEFSSRIPTHWKLSPQGDQKHIFKDAVKDVLPPSIAERKKAGFAVPLHHWFAAELAPMFSDLALNNARCHEFFEPAVIRRMFDENRSGRRDHGNRLWSVLVFEMWLRDLKSTSGSSRNPCTV